MKEVLISIICLLLLLIIGFDILVAISITLIIYLIFRTKTQKTNIKIIKADEQKTISKKSWETKFKILNEDKQDIINKLESISPNFKKYKKNFLKTIKPYIKITPTKSKKLELWNSKFGGYPYLPTNFEYPKNSKNDYLYLAAQINFEEIPKIKNFPEKGILEFFVSANSIKGKIDGNFGVNGISQEDIRILYFENVTKDNKHLINDFNFLKEPNQKNFPDYRLSVPVVDQYNLNFEKKHAPVSRWDYNFDNVVGNRDLDIFDFFEKNFGDKNYKLLDKYSDSFDEYKSKIGGYPAFEQCDPRDNCEYKDYVLLFMIGRQMMGNDGILNFFIKEEDLVKKDFSSVLAHFDCG